jgi:HPt (histidine-containing phosphotransfer) domain-containing protein
LPKTKGQVEKPAEPGKKLYDLAMVDSIGKDDPAFVKNIITIFIETMPGNLDSLVQAGNEKNYDQISKVAHKMKSSIDLLGIHTLKQIIRNLENIVAGDPECDTNIEIVKNTLGDTFIQLKELV